MPSALVLLADGQEQQRGLVGANGDQGSNDSARFLQVEPHVVPAYVRAATIPRVQPGSMPAPFQASSREIPEEMYGGRVSVHTRVK